MGTEKNRPCLFSQEKQPSSAAYLLLLPVEPFASWLARAGVPKSTSALCSTNTGTELEVTRGGSRGHGSTKPHSYFAAAPSSVSACASPCRASQCF